MVNVKAAIAAFCVFAQYLYPLDGRGKKGSNILPQSSQGLAETAAEKKKKPCALCS